MKIIYLVHQFYPEFNTGTEKFVFNNAFMAQKFGNKVKVVTYSFRDNKEFTEENNEILTRNYIFQGIPVLAFKFRNPPNFFDISHDNPQLNTLAKKYIEKENPDVIHVGHPMRVYGFLKTAIDLGIPYIITLTDFFMLCPKVILAPNNYSLCGGPSGGNTCRALCSEIETEFIRKRLAEAEFTLRKAKALVAPSSFVKKIFIKEFNDLNFNVIHHGIQHKYIKQNNKVHMKGDSLTFGFAGTIMQHKGVHLLLDSFGRIEHQNTKLKIYGSGPKNYLDQLQRKINNDKRVTINGEFTSEQLGDIFKEIDVMIIPSMCYENYSMVLHEAFASNIPVIVTNLGGLAEKVEDGFNGFTFPMGNSEELRNKIKMIVEDPTILNGLKDNIRKFMIIPKIEQEVYEYFRIYKKI
jgi:glycosyltransferase involved in cell wall biosynthesis